MANFFKRTLVRAWLIWIVTAIFYAYEFFIRISPAVMVSNLTEAFHVSKAELGMLSAFYYYAYALMQIPVGMLLDRYGTRRLLSFAAITVTLGSVLFATTHKLWVADIGRLLMGVGSAFSFVGCLKLVTNWFSAKQFAVIIGLTNMLGAFGAISAEAPLSLLVTHYGWRATMLFAGIIGALLALLIRMVVRDHPSSILFPKRPPPLFKAHTRNPRRLWAGLITVLKNRRTWLTSIFGGLMVAPISAFTELWGVPFFKQVDHIPTVEAASISSAVFIGTALGGPIIGWLSGKLGRRKPLMMTGAVLALISLLIILLIPSLPAYVIAIVLFLFGFATSSMLLSFALNTESNPLWAAGVVVGFTNMVVMLGGTIFQPLVGWLIDVSVHGSSVSVALLTNAFAYRNALLILPITQIIAFILLFFIRETYCKRKFFSKKSN